MSDNRFIRDITRSAWIDADGNAPEANAQAIDDVRLSRPGVKDTSDDEDLIFQLISYWQSNRIHLWAVATYLAIERKCETSLAAVSSSAAAMRLQPSEWPNERSKACCR